MSLFIKVYISLLVGIFILNGCVSAPVKEDTTLNVLKIDDTIRRADSLCNIDHFAALDNYETAITEAKKELVANPEAVNIQQMKDNIDRAQVGRTLCLIMQAKKTEDTKVRQLYVERADASLKKVTNKNVAHYDMALLKLADLKTQKPVELPTPPLQTEPAIVKPTQMEQTKTVSPEPEQTVAPEPVVQESAAQEPVAQEPVAQDSTEPVAETTDTASLRPEQLSVPEHIITPPSPPVDIPSEGNVLRLKPGSGVTKKGSLNVGESVTYTVVTEGKTKLTIGDLEVCVPNGYRVRGDGLRFTSTKVFEESGDKIFLRFARLKIKPGTRIDIYIIRGDRGPAEYTVPIYLYPR